MSCGDHERALTIKRTIASVEKDAQPLSGHCAMENELSASVNAASCPKCRLTEGGDARTLDLC